MNLKDFRASKYLAKEDVPEAGRNLTIAGFEAVTFDDGKTKPVVSWLEPGVKPMIVNALNGRRLEQMFRSSDTTRMCGQVVNVYNDALVEMQGKIVGGLRIRPATVLPQAAQVPVPPPQYQPPTPPPAQSHQDQLAAALARVQELSDQAKRGRPAHPDTFDQDVPF